MGYWNSKKDIREREREKEGGKERRKEIWIKYEL